MSPSLKLKLSYFGALLVASVCGTSYLFSAYSTALADRLGFNSVQINTIGSAANYGVYLSTPIFGYIVDNYGPQRTCFYTSFLSFTGFFCLAMTYEGYLKPPSFVLCAVYLFLAGVASSAGFVSAIGTVAKNFKSKRGIAFGFPVALFGLSAFLLAQINNFIFNENTFGFLIFLAIITGSSIFIGSWLLIVIPPSLPGEVVDSDHNNRGSNNNENLPSLNSNEGPNNDNRINQLEDAPLINNNHNYNNYNNDDDNNDDNNNDDDDNNNNEPDIGGWEFVQNGDMLFLSSIILLLAGTGLMYINNVGAVIKYLYSQDLNDHEDNNNFTDFSLTNSQGDSPHDAIQKLQNLHVSLISFSSSVGRISAGILSDITKERFNIRRIFYLILSGIYLLSGHTLMGFFADSLTYLYPASILIGLGFGTMFSILPIIISEWFGSRRFGSNWGTVSAFAGLGGQVFNLYFGYNNDLRRKNKCFGTECYRQAFYLSVIGLVICIGITIRLLYRRIKRDSYQQLQNINYY